MDRGVGFRWQFRAVDDRANASMGGIEPLVARVLIARGVTDTEAATTFLAPKLTGLHDPALLPGLARAAERVRDAIENGERIAIYGDYDADGVCATALLYRVFHAVARSLGTTAQITGYIPHRLDEGYGLNAEALTSLSADHSLIISVDCGVTGADAAKALEGTSCDLIVTDHHNINPPQVPRCFAVVHPRLDWALSGDTQAARSDLYPFGELCGAGVAFKLAWRLGQIANTSGSDTQRVAVEVRESLLDCLPLTALATIADIVPLIDENRIIAKHGLALMGKSSITGLHALLEASGLQGTSVDAEGAGFKLAPRLNAAGRLGHAKIALELFITDDPEEAASLASTLSDENTERRRLEQSFAAEALAKAEAQGFTSKAGKRGVVLWDEQWHPGVIGIVCSRLVRSLHKPTILCGMVDGMLKGSGRSIAGFNLHAALDACSSHLTSYGGHDMAAGLSMHPDDFAGFADDFAAYADDHISDEMLVPQISIDATAHLGELTQRATQLLTQLGPFGQANAKPKVLLRGLRVEQSGTMGAHAKHLQVRAAPADANAGSTLRMVGWSLGELADDLPRGALFDAVVTPKINTFRGVTSVEAEIIDIALNELH